MIPNASVTKSDGNTGVVAPSSRGIFAIIAPSSSGTQNQPTSVTKPSLAASTFGVGVLVEYAAHMLEVSGKPVVLVRATATTAAVYGAVALTGTGTSVPTAGATAPYDDFDVLITIVNGGTRGTDGITYTWSLDGGTNKSAVTALGTATSIVIPNSNVTIQLGVGTLVAGDTITVKTTGPRLTSGDISTALESLRVSSLQWEFAVLGGHEAVKATVDTLDAWLAAREAEGRFRGFMVNARMKNAGETEAQYLTAMNTAWSATSSIRGLVCADGGDVASSVPGRGLVLKRPTVLALAARTMKLNYGVDPAYVALGAVNGFGLSDAQGNPKNHDESFYPGLDALRLVTLRSFERRNGTFITNANSIATAGSDYVWVQHIRTMNRACEIVYDILLGQLSRGVHKNPKLGPLGQVYIAEEDAQEIDSLANQALNELRGQVSDLRFTLSRTDDIGSNGPTTLNGDVEVSALAYVKGFAVNATFKRSLSVQQ